MNTKIYHNPRCSKSRETLTLLKQKNIEPEIVLYLENPINEKEIKMILDLLNMKPREILRKKEEEYKIFNLKDKSLSDDEIIKIIAKAPKLLERPIVIHNQKAAIGRPAKNILDLFN